MNLKNRRDKSSSNRSAKAIDAVPIAGIVVAAVLVLSGLSTVGSYHSVFAQQYSLTKGGGGNAATTDAAVGNGFETISLPCQPPECIGNATTGAAGGNATGGAAGVDQSEVMMHLEEVRTALQNNDVQGAMMHLDLAMNLLGGGDTQGNMTSIAASTNSTA